MSTGTGSKPVIQAAAQKPPAESWLLSAGAPLLHGGRSRCGAPGPI